MPVVVLQMRIPVLLATVFFVQAQSEEENAYGICTSEFNMDPFASWRASLDPNKGNPWYHQLCYGKPQPTTRVCCFRSETAKARYGVECGCYQPPERYNGMTCAQLPLQRPVKSLPFQDIVLVGEQGHWACCHYAHLINKYGLSTQNVTYAWQRFATGNARAPVQQHWPSYSNLSSRDSCYNQGSGPCAAKVSKDTPTGCSCWLNAPGTQDNTVCLRVDARDLQTGEIVKYDKADDTTDCKCQGGCEKNPGKCFASKQRSSSVNESSVLQDWLEDNLRIAITSVFNSINPSIGPITTLMSMAIGCSCGPLAACTSTDPSKSNTKLCGSAVAGGLGNFDFSLLEWCPDCVLQQMAEQRLQRCVWHSEVDIPEPYCPSCGDQPFPIQPCPIGTRGNNITCIPCEPGYYAPSPGLSQCIRCPIGSYAGRGAGVCTLCSGLKETTQPSANATSQSDCVCQKQYAMSKSECIECSLGVKCSHIGTRVVDAITRVGFFRGDASSLSADLCVFSALGCGEGLWNSSCVSGHHGILCSTCDTGYSKRFVLLGTTAPCCECSVAVRWISACALTCIVFVSAMICVSAHWNLRSVWQSLGHCHCRSQSVHDFHDIHNRAPLIDFKAHRKSDCVAVVIKWLKKKKMHDPRLFSASLIVLQSYGIAGVHVSAIASTSAYHDTKSSEFSNSLSGVVDWFGRAAFLDLSSAVSFGCLSERLVGVLAELAFQGVLPSIAMIWFGCWGFWYKTKGQLLRASRYLRTAVWVVVLAGAGAQVASLRAFSCRTLHSSGLVGSARVRVSSHPEMVCMSSEHVTMMIVGMLTGLFQCIVVPVVLLINLRAFKKSKPCDKQHWEWLSPIRTGFAREFVVWELAEQANKTITAASFVLLTSDMIAKNNVVALLTTRTSAAQLVIWVQAAFLMFFAKHQPFRSLGSRLLFVLTRLFVIAQMLQFAIVLATMDEVEDTSTTPYTAFTTARYISYSSCFIFPIVWMKYATK